MFPDFAFPKREDFPAFPSKGYRGTPVPQLIGQDLGRPEVGPGFRNLEVLASLVAMPEAAVDEEDGLVFGKNDVGFTRDVLHMKTESETFCRKCLPDNEFGLRVLTPDSRHHFASFLFGKNIRHGFQAYTFSDAYAAFACLSPNASGPQIQTGQARW